MRKLTLKQREVLVALATTAKREASPAQLARLLTYEPKTVTIQSLRRCGYIGTCCGEYVLTSRGLTRIRQSLDRTARV